MCISAGVLTAISLATTVVSTGVSLKRASDAKKAGRINARAADRQAEVAEQQARLAADQKRRQVSRIISSQTARYAASGVTLEGTPLEVLGDTQAQGDLDIETILWNGGVRSEAFTSRGNVLRQRGQSDFLTGIGDAGSTLLGGLFNADTTHRRVTGEGLFTS